MLLRVNDNTSGVILVLACDTFRILSSGVRHQPYDFTISFGCWPFQTESLLLLRIQQFSRKINTKNGRSVKLATDRIADAQGTFFTVWVNSKLVAFNKHHLIADSFGS